MDEQTQPPVQQEEQKPERFDELDFIGRLLLKGLKSFFLFYRKLFKSQEYQK
jgi:hypothetical protein